MNMKSVVIIASALLIAAAGCAPQKTCPTYLKNKTNNVENLKRV